MAGVSGGDLAPPASIPSGDDTVWADASPLIEAACEDLHDGELVHGENFSLFAAMAALEIMDPKMDSGIDNSGYRSVEEAIENGAAPVPLSMDRTLDVQRCIDVMDHLLSCEATWHKGHSLAQTVFSCIYLLRVERTSSHALLHSYCRIMRATCSAVVSMVADARTNEEEDLFTMAYGLPLKVVGDEKCLSILNSVEETLSRQLRSCKAQSSSRKPSEDVESLQDNPDLEEGYCKALLCRLRFRKHFFHVTMCMKKPQGRGLELARKHVAACLAELDCMYGTVGFIRSNNCGFSQEDIEDKTTASGCQPFGFDASLNNKLSAPTPPRAIQIISWKKAVEYFQKLLHDLGNVCLFSMDPMLEDILHFLVQFQKSQPDLVARAHLQLLLVQDGKLYGRDFFYDVIARALGLPECARDQEFQKNEFVVQLGQLVINFLKILCTNTAWQRRKLGKILQDWRVISMRTAKHRGVLINIRNICFYKPKSLEMAVRSEFGEISNVSVAENVCLKVSKYLLIWAEEQTFWIASRFLTLGFELELYSPNEYCMVYWYMYAAFLKLLEKMQMSIGGNSNNYPKKGKKKRDLFKEPRRDTLFSPSCLLLQCYICLCEGLAMMLASVGSERKAFHMPSIFNSEQERFSQHFDHLLKAHVPEHISYRLFVESTAHARISDVVENNYFREAQRIITSLRSSFSGQPDKLAELQQIEQVAAHNHVALNVISRVGSHDPSLKVSFEFTHHPYFAVAVVRRS